MKSKIICAMLQDWKSHYLSYQKQGLFIGTGAKDTTLETYSKHQYTVCGRFRSKLRNGSGSPEETKCHPKETTRVCQEVGQVGKSSCLCILK